MSNKAFQQNLDDKKGPQPGGPYLIQMLFKEPVPMPDKEKMTAVMGKHIGATECFCYDIPFPSAISFSQSSRCHRNWCLPKKCKERTCDAMTVPLPPGDIS